MSLSSRTFRLLRYFEEKNLNPVTLSVQDAIEYKAAIAEHITKNGNRVSAGTCCNSLKAARSLFNYIAASGKRGSNPFLAVPYPRLGEHFSRNFLSEAEMNLLLSNLRHFKDSEGYRVHVLSELLYSTGLRISEAASLFYEDIDIPQRLVHVQHGKGGVNRTAFLTGYAAAVLYHYKKRGRQAVINMYRGKRKKGDNLFCVDYSRLQDSVNMALKKTCTKLELPVITSHGFRHSLGTHLLRSGCDMRHIQIILGHKKLETTQVYTHVDKDDVKASLDMYHPRRCIKECRP